MEAKVGAVIIAGGASRRMGRDKALLTLDGATLLDRIAGELAGFDEVLLSVDVAGRFESALPQVADIMPDCGPIGGVYSALSRCTSDWLIAVGCDMPLFSRGLAAYLASYISAEYDAVVAVTREGRVQPLCGAYARGAREILGAQIAAGDRRMMRALGKMRVKHAELRHSAYPDALVRNVNAPGEYAALRKSLQGPPVVAVSGVKNAGKTTLLENVIPLLVRAGLRVAVIKHDGHDFAPDVPGTDSYRLQQAGACGVAVYSPRRYMLTAEQPNTAPGALAQSFSGADLILLEGGKNTAYPKLEVVRTAVSNATVCERSTVIGLCTDADLPGPTLLLDDYEGIAALLLQYLKDCDLTTE